ncbi:MAG: ABC transporter ATP-binding protein [Rhodospirillales bacterium]|nr:ABC transporter ATP-binding protein [Rhodospirillales bacterium]
MSGVSIRGISKSFGATPVLRDVSVDIGDTEFLTLLGPSGCGKSTLLRIIAGLESHDGGSVAIGGRAIDELRPSERDVAMVFQSYALYPHMTAAENIAVPLTMRALRPWQRLPLMRHALPAARRARAGIAAEVGRVARTLDIEPLLARKPSQLSGGQRQRVALARAMVRRPRAFLMDEPLSNLDAKLRVQARAEIADLHRRLSTTFIYVTHDQAEAMTMSDRVAVMMDGRLLQVAPPADIYDDPADLQVAMFVGSPRINTIAGRTRADGAIAAAGVALPVRCAAATAPGTAVVVAFRPEHVDIEAAGRAGALGGTVRHLENLGPDLYLYVALTGADTVVIVRATPGHGRSFARGQSVSIRPHAARLLLFNAAGRRVAVAP